MRKASYHPHQPRIVSCPSLSLIMPFDPSMHPYVPCMRGFQGLVISLAATGSSTHRLLQYPDTSLCALGLEALPILASWNLSRKTRNLFVARGNLIALLMVVQDFLVVVLKQQQLVR